MCLTLTMSKKGDIDHINERDRAAIVTTGEEEAAEEETDEEDTNKKPIYKL